MDSREILEGVSFYREAPEALKPNMLAAARRVKLAPGDRLFREGEVSSGFAAIGRGSVRVFRLGATGREITLYHVHGQEASLVGMLSALLRRPAIATAQAELETEAVLMPAQALREWVAASESMRSFIFETTTRALIDVATLLEDVAFRTMDCRLATLLLQHFATSRVINMRHEDIAAELGTAREVVSRALESHERLGAITLSRGHIELIDGAILRRLCDSGH
jgi:CRP/FNR family transcriptional regulator, anaerobic regulatory protein